MYLRSYGPKYNIVDFGRGFIIFGRGYFIFHGHFRNLITSYINVESLPKTVQRVFNCFVKYIFCLGAVSKDYPSVAKSKCIHELTFTKVHGNIIKWVLSVFPCFLSSASPRFLFKSPR